MDKESEIKNKVVAVSGGFDPLHIGHIRHFKMAKRLGNKLIVMLNSDRFLKEKKGYVFMNYKERKEILKELKCVDLVVPVIDKDQSVARSLAKYKPDIFAKGGDRKPTQKPIPPQEIEICKKYNIKLKYNVGKKIQASSWLVNRAFQKLIKIKKR